jgi:EVE domain
MHTGGRVYLWRVGADAALVAVATVIDEPNERPIDPESHPFVRDEALGGSQIRVTLTVDRVLDAPLSRAALLEDDVLRDLLILRRPQGTNFAVTPSKDQRLRYLLAQTPTVTCLHPSATRGPRIRLGRRGSHLPLHTAGLTRTEASRREPRSSIRLLPPRVWRRRDSSNPATPIQRGYEPRRMFPPCRPGCCLGARLEIPRVSGGTCYTRLCLDARRSANG